MNNIKLILAAGCCMVALSCQKQPASATITNINTGPDSWHWVFSEGGIGGATINPSSAFIYLTMNSDSSYSIRVGSDIVQEGSYTMYISQGNSILHFDKKPGVANLNLQQDEQVVSLTTDSLQLMDYSITDGFVHHFKKILAGEKQVAGE